MICNLPKFNLNFFLVFVRGEFEDGDVVCTTWTMVMIAVGCVIFLVISILIVFVLCTDNQNTDYQEYQTSHSNHNHGPSGANNIIIFKLGPRYLQEKVRKIQIKI